MAELPTDTTPFTAEDRELIRRLRLVAQQNENRMQTDPDLKELLEMLCQPEKAIRDEDDAA